MAKFIDTKLPWDWKTTGIEPDDLDSKVLITQFKKKLAQKGWLTMAWMQSRSLIPNKEASISKVFGTEMVLRLYNLAMQIMGPYGQLEPDSNWAPLQGRIENGWMRAFIGPVGAGTSEIQRNIIATRGLGLPRA